MARSMTNQVLWLQKESSPGVAATNAMKRVLGIRGRPGFNDEGEGFKAAGSKVDTAWIQNNETGAPVLDLVQCFNAFTWILTGGFGAPTSGLASGATGAYEHVYTLNPSAPDPKATFTAIWGDSTEAVQMLHFFFQSLSIGVQRGGTLSVSANAMSREPTFDATLPASGTSVVPAQPIGGRMWDVYADDDWADAGTTKLLAAYEGGIDFGDKYVPDYVINSAVSSFSETLEAEDTTYGGNLRLGFDATAIGLSDTFKAGATKVIRLQATGPEIETGHDYSLAIDMVLRITGRGEISAAPNSPAVSIPFNVSLTTDADGNAARATLVNTVSAL